MLLLKLRLGLFERPYVDAAQAHATWNDPGHREVARVATERSAVLLRNEDDVLPLDRATVRLVAVLGPLADDRAAMLEPWVFAEDQAAIVTVLEGLRRVGGTGVQVEYAPGVPMPVRLFPSPFTMLGLGAVPPAPPFDEETKFARAVTLTRAG